jgi:hypothetical protein
MLSVEESPRTNPLLLTFTYNTALVYDPVFVGLLMLMNWPPLNPLSRENSNRMEFTLPTHTYNIIQPLVLYVTLRSPEKT